MSREVIRDGMVFNVDEKDLSTINPSDVRVGDVVKYFWSSEKWDYRLITDVQKNYAVGYWMKERGVDSGGCEIDFKIPPETLQKINPLVVLNLLGFYDKSAKRPHFVKEYEQLTKE